MTLARRPSPRGRPGPLARAGRACRLAGLGIATVVAISAAGCGGPSPSISARPAAGDPALAVLAARDGASSIVIHAAGGSNVEATSPPREVQWLAADTAGRLVATMEDGAVLRTVGALDRGSRWEPVRYGRAAGAASRVLTFAVPGPSSVIAGLLADYGSGAPASLALVDAPENVRVVGLGVEANGAPPAWLSAATVAVPGLRPDGALGMDLVDVATGRVSPGPGGVREIAVSGDGGRFATVAADQRTVSVASTAAWPSAVPPASGAATGASPTPAPSGAIVPAEPEGVVTALSLDATGRSLAIAWTDRNLVPAVVVRYGDVGGWRELERVALPTGTVRAAVAWLTSAAIVGSALGGGIESVAARLPRTSSSRSRGRPPYALTAVCAVKIETWASSGSMTPRIFWSARRWTQAPQLSK